MASSTHSRFVYDALPKQRGFRYLKLHSGREEDLLACSLHTARIEDAPQYEAISYVWGSDKLDYRITCNGEDLYITRNLSMVLRHLRLRAAARVLWADSICINQGDLEEKGYQVAIMSDIYRSAASVLIYMGEDLQEHGQLVKSLVEDVSSTVEQVMQKIDTSVWNTFPFYEEDPFSNDSRGRSLRTLLNQEWFTRGWVVREAALAQHGQVIWGQSIFSWKKLMLTLLWFVQRGQYASSVAEDMFQRIRTHLDAFVDRHISQLRCLIGEGDWARNSILEYLNSSRRLHMSDPRDRLYAFVDISTEEDRQVNVKPRYGDTPQEVYHEFASEYIRTLKNPKILDHVLHDAKSLHMGVPTWVPCWDHREHDRQLRLTDKELTTRTFDSVQPNLLGTSILKVRGVVLDCIEFASDVFDGPSTTLESLADLWNTVQSRASNTPYQTSLLQVFISTLTATRFRGDWETWQRKCKRYAQRLMEIQNFSENCTDRIADVEGGRVHAQIKDFVHKRKLVITSRGYMGLGPAVVQEGDLCAIVFGCTMPCALRPTGQENQFQFLGPCFLLGSREYSDQTIRAGCYVMLGSDYSKDWLDWDVDEQDIFLC